MRIIAVDPSRSGLDEIMTCVRQTHPGCDITGFHDPLMAAKYVLSNPADALYTVVKMNRLDGLTLAQILKSEYPDMLLNFVCSGEEYRRDAINMGANSYAVRPLNSRVLYMAENGQSRREFS